MPSLQERLAAILSDVMRVEEEPDGGLTVRHDGTFASLRVVTIVEDLDLVSLTQILAWDLPLTEQVSEQLAKQAREANFGSVTTVEKPAPRAKGTTKTATRTAAKTADVMLRYNFPGAGLTDDALRTLILLVLDSGTRIRNLLVT
ncbi:hypothetical protein MKUB_53280 [Mycobacterium kubicae]|uniref:Uncharacterized protein n=1 Tax=Mycobacterium kubicae TaxID=120959 RepID=A0AAX1J6N3_9MYCO|nr:hypothetical protein [Mycobacterium kubicae]MCV7095165.1 hypothetical protein [Mycobacterium kubicae]OBF19878.1 hypothetical protein A5725_17825 [Mycobacterium kubicae]OBK55412.1 hypothetical protein A5657_11550 [Mycobacterium kubicae]ORW05677.1 hypothetical protein AWC13_25190 [Mycobacterium kubicae]QNI12749.1 hypothetical protein GAN18_17465 [Mycobacterium kubicae]